ncbi:MAG: methionyl-tRNA formyltransferase, partial [Thermoleophilia bacterium]|nr:methionyl-tRNA formyltransferase [Thermoleophilia bacterium]
MSSVANVYMGTSEFAVEVLRVLAGSAHRPLLVVTPPDRPKGRGRKLSSPPVADFARELGIDLHQTASVNEPGSAALLRACGAELGIVCAFGQLIKEPLLSELPMLNVHPSLL